MSDTFVTPDLWWEARQSHQPKFYHSFYNRAISYAGRATKPYMSLLGDTRSNAGIIIDLNKYRDGKNLKAYQDAGVNRFFLRIGGPGAWVQGAWAYQLDKSFKPYMEQLDKLGLVDATVGYIVHNAFEDYSINGATGETVHTSLIDDWTSGGYMPGAFAYDHEVNKCWRGSTQVFATGYNLVESLKVNTQNTFEKFKRKVGIYSGKWFINANDPTRHMVYFDNINKDAKNRPMWLAWYGQTFSKQYSDFSAIKSELLVPTNDQLNKFLKHGSYSDADLWQFTSTLKITGDTVGVDGNITMMSLADFDRIWGLKVGTPNVPGDPIDEVTKQKLLEEVTKLRASADAIENLLKG